MLLLSLNTMAQIDPNDLNWTVVINDDFSENRFWDRHWDDSTGNPGYKPIWRCFCYNLWHSGVTKYSKKHPNYSAYQKSNSVFSSDGTIKLVGQFKSAKNMTCDNTYDENSIPDTLYFPAPWHRYCHGCDSIVNPLLEIHYYSGMIESTDSLGYGYFEIRCKMPTHVGSHDAFWFWGDYGKYEEIDVFEHGSSLCDGDTTKGFNSGIYYNPDGPNYTSYFDSINGVTVHGAYNFAHCSYHTPVESPPLDQYHTYGCLWLPERIAWYYDGNLYNEETDPSHIPQHPMWLKITHHIDRGASPDYNSNDTWWLGTDEMTIDYVRAYKLDTECNINSIIRNSLDFYCFRYKVKHSITMGGQNAALVIPNGISFTMRAVEHITIDGAFEVPLGTEMTLITQSCPECFQEGVHSQNYCPD